MLWHGVTNGQDAGQRWQTWSLLCTATCSTGVKSSGQRFLHWYRLLEDQQAEEVFLNLSAMLSALLGDEVEARTVVLRVLWRRSLSGDLCTSQGFVGELQSPSAVSGWRCIPQHTNLFFLGIFYFLRHIQLVHTLVLKLLAYSLGAELSSNGLLPAGACMARRLLNSQERFGTQVLPAVPHHQVIGDVMRGPEQSLQSRCCDWGRSRG